MISTKYAGLARVPTLRLAVLVACSLSSGFAFTERLLAGDEIYQLGRESQRQEGVPRGKVIEHVWKSEIFAGTLRRYWTYVPQQYDASKASPVMVFQDGHTYVSETGDYRAPVVLDNLIHAGDIPPLIGVFIDPGHKKDALPEKPGWNPKPENRSFEYDSLSDQYARFLLDEILPEVARAYNLSTNPMNVPSAASAQAASALGPSPGNVRMLFVRS